MTSRIFFGGRLYPEALSAGAAGFESDEGDCAVIGTQVEQTMSAPTKKQFQTFRTCINFLRFILLTEPYRR
jgi:hypothetical protein